jgi:hypothetical protein
LPTSLADSAPEARTPPSRQPNTNRQKQQAKATGKSNRQKQQAKATGKSNRQKQQAKATGKSNRQSPLPQWFTRCRE